MNNKYFVPEIEDLFIGYQCEYKHNCTNCVDISWKPFIINQDFLAGGYSESNYYGDELLRTPYLTKEQIEKEGWELDDFDLELCRFYYKHYELVYFDYQNYKPTFTLWIKSYGDFMFNGRIRCINEFRKLLKMLEI